MKKAMLVIVCGAFAMGLIHNTAYAIPQFAKEFAAMYADEDGTDAQKALAAKVKKVKCNVCHDAESKSKKDRNDYGAELSELLDKKEDKDNKEKIHEALEKVAAMKSSDDGPTYGELLKEGKLPVGDE